MGGRVCVAGLSCAGGGRGGSGWNESISPSQNTIRLSPSLSLVSSFSFLHLGLISFCVQFIDVSNISPGREEREGAGGDRVSDASVFPAPVK